MQETFDKIRAIIIKRYSNNKSKIDMKTSYNDDLCMDSLSTVEFIIQLEDEFGIQIPDEDSEQFKTVEDTVKYIEHHLNYY